MSTLDALPQDILLLIVAYLDAPSLLRLQLTSHTYATTFSDPLLLRSAFRSYPHARESRALFSPSPTSSSSPDLLAAFRTLAARYHHLTRCQPRTLSRLPLRALDQSGHWFPVPQWDYHESQPGGRLYHESAASHLRIQSSAWKPYLFRPTLWAYDDGLLVYAPALTGERHERMRDMYVDGAQGAESKGKENADDRCLKVIDLEQEDDKHANAAGVEVPFDVREKIIRNIRINKGLLVIEWAEKEPFHELNMVDRVHRHFATLFEVTRRTGDTHEDPSTTASLPRVSVTVRSELKIHFLGFPLTSRDYFFSTHTAQHYALYYWQPNRSLWTGDEDQPIEALAIWDISRPSSYRPSLDPSSAKRPDPKREGPRMIAKFTWRELEWLGPRQGANIALMGLQLDSDARTITINENSFVSGQGYFDPAERNWCATCTTFPFVGNGPVLQRRGEVELPPYRGHCSMESAGIEEIERWFLPIIDAVDVDAKVRFALIETCFTGMGMENRIMLRLKVGEQGQWKNVDDSVVKELGSMGRIAGDERWLVGQNARLQLVVARFQ